LRECDSERLISPRDRRPDLAFLAPFVDCHHGLPEFLHLELSVSVFLFLVHEVELELDPWREFVDDLIVHDLLNQAEQREDSLPFLNATLRIKTQRPIDDLASTSSHTAPPDL